MRAVLRMILGFMVVGQIATANIKVRDFDSLKSSVLLSGGQYVVDFTSDLDNCVMGEMNLTSKRIAQRFFPEVDFKVSGPVNHNGLAKPAVCLVGFNTATTYMNVATPTTIVAPEGYKIKCIRKVSQTTTVSTSDTEETDVDAGEYIVKIIEPTNCFQQLNFNLGYTYGDTGLLESVDVTSNGPVERDIARAICLLEDSEAVGTVYLPRGPVMMKTTEGSTVELTRIDETIIL